ncbi:EAL domain-containing protein [Piscinibacter sp. HJYY11]|uniref:bifunctional diguanylate cyclase/phosphodiesterase n=1 Tax=Piscinibacter sp. HJYY11 TaxID=2801333 RepID=UPI00191D1C1F|nr:EAL domain-containing protein [Piscinibacter sp. HJYY11]MBL0727040.1 EAL domain-containing protein [Piscinibacter sp. HJYY11]
MSAQPSRDGGERQMVAMYSVLSATNEALLFAKTPAELFQRVCDAAVDGHQFLTAAVTTPDADTAWLRVEAASGIAATQLRESRISVDAKTIEGQGLVGEAYRGMKPAISNQFMQDPRTKPWHGPASRAGVASAAAIPIVRGTQAFGVMLFYAREVEAFGASIVALLERMARNIVFALDNFDREAERQHAEAALRRSEERYRNILESLDDAYYEVDLKGKPVYLNGAYARMLGYDHHHVAESDYRSRQTAAMTHVVFKAFNEVYRTGVSKKSQYWEYLHRDGSVVQVEGSVLLVKDENGQPVGFRGILRDVTERRRTDQALRNSEARFRAMTNLSSDWYWETDAEIRFTRLDSRETGQRQSRNPLLGRRIWESTMQAHLPGGWDDFRTLIESRRSFRDIVMQRVAPGKPPYYISMSGEPMVDAIGTFLGYRGISREITDQKVAEEHIHHMARHDSLTGLPNRLLFSNLLNAALKTAERYKRTFAVMFIDLDRFKFINDTLGHEAGDTLLKEITARFKQALRGSDVIARLGGDEFVVLVQEVPDREHAAIVARKLLSAAIKPIELMGQECRVTASVGISLFPGDGQDEQTLMKNADSAMYHAKEEGKNNFQFYSSEISTQTLERLTLESNLRRALEKQELSLAYQAKVDLKSGRITGVEALLRWHNAELGMVSPAKFIPVAEETGLIVHIGRWVMKTACLQNVAWQQQGLPPINMAVNLSVRQFADEHLLDDVTAILQETGMDPKLLELEITEGMIVHNVDRAIKLLTAIKQLGVRLAIDDFGTGYSSLGQLKNFPIDTLKVDRSFIRDLATDSEDKAITSAIIAMGKTLSLTVVAEGVETAEQQTFLREQACDEMQGYYFSKPVAPEEFAALLGKEKAT